MITPKDESLQMCLQKTGLRALPKALSQGENKIWINAIVLVRKIGIENYCLATNNGFGLPQITQDFGPCIAITQIVSIHPIECVSGKFVPDLRSKQQIITFLVKNGHNEAVITELLNKDGKTPEQIKEDKAIVQGYINRAAVSLAKQELAERERCRNIREYAEKVKSGEKTD